MDNPPTVGDNLGTAPDTPDACLTPGDLTVTYAVDMTTKTPPEPVSAPRYLRPHQVAALLGVARQTVHDHQQAGRLDAIRTPGGHRRYPADQPALQEALQAAGEAR